MRVVCPSCTAAYDVPDAAIGAAPRRLRCARCQQEWTVDPATAKSDTDRAPVAAPEPPEETDRIAEPRPPGSAPDEPVVPPAADPADTPTKPPMSLFAEHKIGADGGPRPASGDAPRPKLPSFEGRAASVPRGRVAAGGIVLAWLLSVTVLGLCAAGAVIWRTDVMRAWPPSERAYVMLGLQ